MSVLVKGWEIPKSCENCPFFGDVFYPDDDDGDDEFVCSLGPRLRYWQYAGKEEKDCPLIEIVHCRDCAYGEIDDPDFPDQYKCNYSGCDWNKGDFFCAYGDKRRHS